MKNVFIWVDYSSAVDCRMFRECCRHVAWLEQVGAIDVMNTDTFGMLEAETEELLLEARIVIPLISVDFLNMAYRWHRAQQILFAYAQYQEVKILPVIIGPSHFLETEFARFQPVNTVSCPVSKLRKNEREMVWKSVAEAIKECLPQGYIKIRPATRKRFSAMGNGTINHGLGVTPDEIIFTGDFASEIHYEQVTSTQLLVRHPFLLPYRGIAISYREAAGDPICTDTRQNGSRGG